MANGELNSLGLNRMEGIFNFLNNHLNPVPVLGEILRIFPDGIIWGVGFFSILTFSYQYGMFFVALVESLLIYHGIHNINTYLGIYTDNSTEKSVASLQCKTGFTNVTLQSLSLFGLHKGFTFPSAPIYIVSVAMSYVLSVLLILKKDLDALGTDYSSRLYLATIGLSSLFLIFSIFRVFKGCDTLLNIILSGMIGFIIGALLLQQNRLLLGMDGINMLGIPLLYGRTATGENLYVCNQTV